MRKFWYATGEMTEVQRYINVPMHWWEQYPARERREFWVRRTDGARQEVKFVVHSRSMPARIGHQVRVLLRGDMVVGLLNLSTGRRINFVREDPPLALRRGDVLVALGILAAGGVFAVGWDVLNLIVAMLIGVLYLPILVLGRWLWRRQLRGLVDRALRTVCLAEACETSKLWRVK